MRISSSIIALCLLTPACDTYGDEHDTSLARWCGDALCDWSVETGEVEKIHTWHAHELGTALTATPTRISRNLNSLLSCMRVVVVGDIEPRAQVELRVEQLGGSGANFVQRLSTHGYEKLEFLASFGGYRDGLHLVVHKKGVGTVRLAEITLEFSADCSGAGVLYPVGAECRENAECETNTCIDLVCTDCNEHPCSVGTSCNDDAHCSSGSCVGGLCASCGGAAERCELGESCDDAADCRSGTCLANFTPSATPRAATVSQCAECASDDDCAARSCVFGACASCRDDADCSAGDSCRYAPGTVDTGGRACRAAEASASPRGVLCESDDDCADLPCGAEAGLAPRCGVACTGSAVCGEGEVCVSGARRLLSCRAEFCGDDPESYSLSRLAAPPEDDTPSMPEDGAGTCLLLGVVVESASGS